MEATLRNLSKAFREISFIAAAWLKETHHSLQKQEVRLEQVEQDARDQGREIHANATDISCMQINQELHKERLERLEGIIHSQEQALLAQGRKLKEVEEGRKERGKELRAQAQTLEDWELTCHPRACPIAGADGRRASESEPSTLDTITGSSEACTGEVTPPEKVKGAQKGSPRVWRLPPQPQG